MEGAHGKLPASIKIQMEKFLQLFKSQKEIKSSVM